MTRALFLSTVVLTALAAAQSTPSGVLRPADALPTPGPGLRIVQPVQTGEPFTVSGPRGVLLGQQQGVFEAWVLPVKLLSHFTLEANVEGYPVPLDLNSMAREIEICPSQTTITYSHIAVTVRQTMFSAEAMPQGTGPVVVFSIHAVRPVDLIFRFTPEMRPMWPQPDKGVPSAEWVPQGSSGFYLLHTDYPDFTGAVAMPGATSGILAPYQERPQVHPLELHLHFDPRHDAGKTFPLLMAVGQSTETATAQALLARLQQVEASLAQIDRAHQLRTRTAQAAWTALDAPDPQLHDDLAWAETSIDQLRARAPDGELGLVAGYYASGDSARPGFGWFFGRDALYTLYALDSYGDFPLARTELEFLLQRQREDGKIMHEYSQTAAQVDWKAMPYQYAAADATPLLLMALWDYVRSSGDTAFLRDHQDAVLRAWNFETTHDSDGDGIYDNAQGTGWVESWPPGMPRQEIYLALLDEQASAAVGQLAALLGRADLAQQATLRAHTVHRTLEREYYDPHTRTYAFSRNAGGALDTTATVFPALAQWDGGPGLDHPAESLRAWSSHRFDTDWGVRDLADDQPLYDPISYHQGSVWPLFTGWAALAEYRAGNGLAGYQLLLQNAQLTQAQDPGAVTELLSGAFFEPFGRSTSHQLWSSAMVATPLLRGLLGLTANGLQHTLSVHPQLPANWPGATVRGVHVGDSRVDVTFTRRGPLLHTELKQLSGPPVSLAGARPGATALDLPLPAVEVALAHLGLPLRGSATSQTKVLAETRADRSLQLVLEAPGGTTAHLTVVRNDPRARPAVQGAESQGDTLAVSFPPGDGYQTQVVTLTW